MSIQVRFHKPKFTKKALAEVQKTGRFETGLEYLLWTFWPTFHFTSHGLYLEAESKPGNYRKLVRELGKFNSEGLVNHIHLEMIVRNPVHQYRIGVAAIRLWSEELRKLKKTKNYVIYLNESHETSRRVNYTLCIYSNPLKSELASLESKWRNPVEALNAGKFLKWASKRV